jgi:hypothetical protein
MDLGIIGLARSGKTSLFNAVTHGSAAVGAYSSRERPNVGVVHVPDARVDALAAIFKPKRTTYAEVRWVDYPVAGFGPEGPGAPFLAELASMDAIVHVVRAFEDESVPHPEGGVDPHRDIESLDLELTFADLALIERRLGRLETEIRSAKAADRGPLERDHALLTMLQEGLEAGRAVREIELSGEHERDLAHYQFVTRRPVLLVLNIGEDEVGRTAAIEAEFAANHARPGVAVVALCAKLEAELAALEPADAAEFRRDLGLAEESLADRAIGSAYELLGLQSFITVDGSECRAWTVRRGATALEAAGKVHSDMERGFIRAEVARWDELAEAGSLAELRRRGKLRTEGRSYVVQDGDVLHVLFNV